MGISKLDIHDVASSVKTLLQSDETKRHLHGLLFKLYGDFVSADGDIPGIPRAVITDFLLSERTKEIETLNREKNPTEEDIKRKQELQSEIQGIQELKRQQDDTCAVAHKAARAKALIPDLIVETIEQKATVVLAYYYHWLVKHENTDEEIEQLRNEWARWVRAKPGPNKEPLGLQFFLGECANVPQISPKGHEHVRKWITELGEKIEPVSSEEPVSGESLPELKGRNLHWVGREYSLTDIQAKVMAEYVKEYLRDPEATLKGAEVCTQLDISQRQLRRVFDDGKRDAWELFEQPDRGYYRLKKPSPQ